MNLDIFNQLINQHGLEIAMLIAAIIFLNRRLTSIKGRLDECEKDRRELWKNFLSK